MYQDVEPKRVDVENNRPKTTATDDSLTNEGQAINGDSNKSQSFQMPRAPPHVYSCFVVNRTSEQIECMLKYDGRPGEEKFDEVINVTIPANSEHYFPRKFFQPDLPESYCKWVKIVTHVRVKKQNGKFLEIDYPFENVHAPIRNWEFHVRDEGDILSKPPTRVVNVLKYENLDQYEC
ncbi:unnamed protein product [Rotaria socialis]|uniref:Uncharacterized protein n=1 Tax=Rotaria socialis TaxID=392032 RepID=A0A817XQS9_9BILA|nr:unnamed protein product [Rotaria socialis]CAF3371785.1 unnamed protein product [Rotaria socialis]CAF3419545.1 unnamed protein product [Rotaria socialis]CAF3472759.1 unnamed protein product [Rotaria socialis]CAF4397499.1 unnamed protein product [Rotaria socialis]